MAPRKSRRVRGSVIFHTRWNLGNSKMNFILDPIRGNYQSIRNIFSPLVWQAVLFLSVCCDWKVPTNTNSFVCFVLCLSLSHAACPLHNTTTGSAKGGRTLGRCIGNRWLIAVRDKTGEYTQRPRQERRVRETVKFTAAYHWTWICKDKHKQRPSNCHVITNF